MNSIERAIKRAYEIAKERNWNKIYWAVDIHSTLTASNYSEELPTIFPEAIEAIQYLNSLPETVLILWSSCYPEYYEQYFKMFNEAGMKFNYFNENPEVPNSKTGCFDSKFYFSIILDDKAGFCEEDWIEVVTHSEKYRKLIG